MELPRLTVLRGTLFSLIPHLPSYLPKGGFFTAIAGRHAPSIRPGFRICNLYTCRNRPSFILPPFVCFLAVHPPLSPSHAPLEGGGLYRPWLGRREPEHSSRTGRVPFALTTRLVQPAALKGRMCQFKGPRGRFKLAHFTKQSCGGTQDMKPLGP